jgi:cobalt/nickel transport system permease protein
MTLFAVHLLDGFLPLSWCLVGYFAAIALAAFGSWRLHERDIPRIALATAAFFVASSIHIYIPPSPASVHLVLNGLVGIMLGFRAGLALFVGLFLQAVLIHHGGKYTLGVNVVLQSIPAIAVGGLFRLIAARNITTDKLAIAGGLLGSAAVLATVLLQSGFLWFAGDNGVMPALLWFGLHVPIAFIEGIVVGFMVHFLARVKPELLGLSPPSRDAEKPRDEFANSVVASDEIN